MKDTVYEHQTSKPGKFSFLRLFKTNKIYGSFLKTFQLL